VPEKEQFMNRNGAVLFQRWILVGLCLALLATIACSKKQLQPVQQDDPKPMSSDATHFDGGTYCVQAIPQGLPVSQAIHFSNRENESDGSYRDFETDLSSDKLDVSFHQRRHSTEIDQPTSHPEVDMGSAHIPAGTITVADGYTDIFETNHYTRSDAHRWLMGTTLVPEDGTPSGLFISKPRVTKVGHETINGFETDKYAIDTTQQTHMDKVALLMAGQLKDYNITGTAWVAKQPVCILQYQIDYEEDRTDGSVQKVHYEGGATRK
jgi:hypothetical protein